ncbi:hypothetical protein JL722_1385 [Aureococcus anophagefferens]|nr:hypothetical protein JL722_1385 [Aureococcus anophagefferens]
MASFAAGDWLWLDSAEDSWIPVRAVAAFKAGEAGQAEAEDGSAVSIDAKASSFCHLMDDQSLGELEDMTQFNDLSEGPLLHNLRKRCGKGGIYTWVGSILVAVNPFQVLPNCYTPENLARYAICISGESGAGKTESMKLMLQFLAEASGRASGAAKRPSVPGIDDKRDYDDVATALRALSFSDDEGLSVWKVVAGLLHVGNVAFAAGPKDEATVADAAPLETGSAVLGLDAAALREGLISKNIGTRSIIRTELSAAQADGDGVFKPRSAASSTSSSSRSTRP